MTCVRNFRTRTRFHRLRNVGSTGPVPPVDMADDAECSKPAGFGDIVKTVLGQGRIGVAIYTCGQELRLEIDGKQFDMLRPEFRAERINVLPFVKKFTVWQGAESVLSLRYLCTDVLEDSHAGTRDILKFVSEVSESRERRFRFYLVWQAIQLGQDVTSDDARARLEEAVKQSCQ